MVARDSLELSIVGRWASLSLEGEYDLANAERIPNAARYLLARGVTEMTFDLCRVEFLDVSAINALRSTNDLLTRRGGRLLLVGLSELVARVLRLTGLDRALPALGDLPGAVGRPRRAADADGPASADGLAADLALLAREVLVEDTLTGDLSRVVRAAAGGVPGCSAASCTLVALGQPRTAAASDPVAVDADVVQYEGGGPCVRAVRTGKRATLRLKAGLGLEDDDRAMIAAATAVQDVCSVPIGLYGATVGSLNCYTTEASFGEDAAASAEVLASLGAAAIERSFTASSARRLMPATGGLHAVLHEEATVPVAGQALAAAAYRHLGRRLDAESERLAGAAHRLARTITG